MVKKIKRKAKRARKPLKPLSGYSTPTNYAPLAVEIGIRIHTRADGISLPYLHSLYGEKRA